MTNKIFEFRHWIKQIILLILFISIAIFYRTDAAGDRQRRIGKEFVFREQGESLQKYRYHDFLSEAEIGIEKSKEYVLSGKLPYKDYVGVKGKVVAIIPKQPDSPNIIQRVCSFWKIQLETGEILYYKDYSEVSDDQIDGVYFIDDYNEAKNKIGKYIWINQDAMYGRQQRSYTENENVSYPLDHLEKVMIVDVYTKELGHVYGASPFYIKVKKESGEIGLIGYNARNFFENPPVELSKIKTSFDFRKSKWGMSVAQVKATESNNPVVHEKCEKSSTVVFYEDTIAGLQSLVVYIFAYDKLVRAKYMITEEHTNKTEYLSDYENLSSKVSEKYGKPAGEHTFWHNDLYKNDHSKWGLAISIGHLSKFTRWKTSNTNIDLSLCGDKSKVELGIEYSGRQLQSLEEKADKEEEQEKF